MGRCANDAHHYCRSALGRASWHQGVLVGKSGIGKTSQLWTLNPIATLFMDLEAGDLAAEGYQCDTIRPRTWQDCRDFAVFIGGPNPALRDDQPYSQAHFDAVCGRFGDPAVLDKYETLFWTASPWPVVCACNGARDSRRPIRENRQTRQPWRLRFDGPEMIGWLTHLQHTRRKNVWFVGILNEALDDFQSPRLLTADRWFQDRPRTTGHCR